MWPDGLCSLPDARKRPSFWPGIDRGLTPFLHCYSANAGAVALYEALGFRTRAQMSFTILALDE